MRSCYWASLGQMMLLAVALLGAFHAVPGLAATLLVSNTNDTGAGSLRQAIADNATLGGSNTIVFAGNVTGIVTLATQLVISDAVTVVGPGQQVLTVSGNDATRVLLINAGNVAISGLTIANGNNLIQGSGIEQPGGSLTLSNCVVMNCTNSRTDGGGIFSGGNLWLIGCTICSNTGYDGGALSIGGSGNVTIINSTICSNTATGPGPISGGGGGGIYFSGTTLSISNSTIFANSCISTGFGGGILTGSAGTLSITSSTIASNVCAYGNGGGLLISPGSVTALVMNTIIAGNSAPGHIADCGGIVSSGGYNLIGQTNGSSGWSASLQDQFGSAASPLDPRLGPLESNGGLAATVALLPDSPAIDRGKSFGLTTDQRGAPRPFDFAGLTNAPGGDGSDIGAFELGSPRLNIQPAGNNVLLTWPSWYGDFVLETAEALSGSTVWNGATNTPLVIGNQFTVTNAASDTCRFYRLKAF